MMLHEPTPDPLMDSLLERGRNIPAVSDVVRARSLARARAVVTATVVPAGVPVPGRSRRMLAVALAASITLTIGAAGAIGALGGRVFQTPPAPAPRATHRPPVRTFTLAAPPAASELAAPAKPAHVAHPVRPPTPQESYAAELELLQRAQAAYAGGNFAGALLLVAEHHRRFPDGRLAEEREALRVRSLADAGRTDEAARAAASFAERFPRSVLLKRSSRVR
jgi:hypothetical protein